MMQRWLNGLCGGTIIETEGQPERHPLDVPFSFVCGERSSREWIKRENAVCDLDSWLVCQLILPEKQGGAILAFRRPASPMTSGCFRLQGLDAAGTYTFEDADDGAALEASGQDLMGKGLPLAIETARASRLVFYRKIR